MKKSSFVGCSGIGTQHIPCLLEGLFIILCSLIVKKSAVSAPNSPGGAHAWTDCLPSTSSRSLHLADPGLLFPALLAPLPPVFHLPTSCHQVTPLSSREKHTRTSQDSCCKEAGSQHFRLFETLTCCLCCTSFFFKKIFFKFIDLFLFLAVLGLCCCTWAFSSAAIGGYSSLRCAGFLLQWLLLLQSMGSRCAGFSCSGTWA